ncbi:MAG: hypothetical protein AAF465_09975 [Pseudomonadota bacterium]
MNIRIPLARPVSSSSQSGGSLFNASNGNFRVLTLGRNARAPAKAPAPKPSKIAFDEKDEKVVTAVAVAAATINPEVAYAAANEMEDQPEAALAREVDEQTVLPVIRRVRSAVDKPDKDVKVTDYQRHSVKGLNTNANLVATAIREIEHCPDGERDEAVAALTAWCASLLEPTLVKSLAKNGFNRSRLALVRPENVEESTDELRAQVEELRDMLMRHIERTGGHPPDEGTDCPPMSQTES